MKNSRKKLTLHPQGSNESHDDDSLRQMLVISAGELKRITVRGFDAAAHNGQHLAAVRTFIKSNDPSIMRPFTGRAILDAEGVAHIFETDPRILHSIAAAQDTAFDHAYNLSGAETLTAKIEYARRVRTQNRLERLETDKPACGMCGESDDRCLERHHIAGRKHDDIVALICRNCHRKVSDDQKDHPTVGRDVDPGLAALGRFLIGLADMLRIIIERLYIYGRLLIERAAKAEGGAA